MWGGSNECGEGVMSVGGEVMSVRGEVWEEVR